jgi:hypothetical protein
MRCIYGKVVFFAWFGDFDMLPVIVVSAPEFRTNRIWIDPWQSELESDGAVRRSELHKALSGSPYPGAASKSKNLRAMRFAPPCVARGRRSQVQFRSRPLKWHGHWARHCVTVAQLNIHVRQREQKLSARRCRSPRYEASGLL